MAITFTTGTINAASAAAVGQAMAEKIRDDVVAHAAWDLVEEYAPGSMVWYVFKCLATSSGLPADFYVIMQRTISDGSLRLFVAEDYNSGTHTVSHYGEIKTSETTIFDSLGRAPATYVLSTSQLNNIPTSNPRCSLWGPSGTSTKWWLAVDNDGFSVAFNGASNGYFHCGAYTPLSVTPSAMPIQWIDGNLPGGITRNPACASITTKGGALSIQGGNQAASVNSSPPLGFLGRMDQNDHLQSDLRVMAECGIVIVQNSTPDSATYGYVIGKQKRMRIGLQNSAPAGMAFGDAYAMSSRLWVPYLPTDFRVWDTGVAA